VAYIRKNYKEVYLNNQHRMYNASIQYKEPFASIIMVAGILFRPGIRNATKDKTLSLRLIKFQFQEIKQLTDNEILKYIP
jgi:hypothetical protein